MKFSLVIPCYNEANSLPHLLKRCEKLSHTDGIEVVLVDNGSTDNSAEVLQELLPKYPGCVSIRVDNNQGYGFGIIAGLEASRGELLGWTHADLQTDPEDVFEGLKFFERYGRETFVKGRRYGRPFFDVIFTLGMSVFETLLLRKTLFDINAQPTIFSREFFNSWQNPPHDFSLDLFAYYMAKHHDLAVHRFPVLFGKRAHGVSHWNINWAAKRKFIRRTIDFSLKLRKAMST